jgi:RNA polymerase sigma-70 factor (ECF subfamily)
MDGHPIAGRLQITAADDAAARLAFLFDTHHDRLYRLARRLASSTDDALDLVQETFLRVARSPESMPAGSASAEEAWLVRILVNICRDQWRKHEVRTRHARTADDSIRAAHGSQTSETALVAKTAVWQALDLLPPRRRAIIVMHELEAMPVSAIASLLGISTITVRWHLSAGRRELAQALKPYQGDTP